VEFIVNGDNSILNLLKGFDFRMFNWIKCAKRLFKEIAKADFIIIDSYLANKKLYSDLSKKMNGRMLMIDDYYRLDYPKGIVVNPSVQGNSLKYRRFKGVKYLLGKDYVILRDAALNAPKKVINREIKSVMLTFGGADRKNLTAKLLRILQSYCPRINKIVVIGRGFKSIERIEEIADKMINLEYYPEAEKMIKLMLNSDVAISAGGQTLYELARIGVPTIGICVSDNQAGNILGLEREGFLKYAGRPEDINFTGNVIQAISELKEFSVRKNMSKTGQKLFDGKGAKRITSEILKLSKEGKR